MAGKGLKVGLTLMSFLLLGQQPFCPDQEYCDGEDNDADGHTDEDFDFDGDGYLDAEECAGAYDPEILDCDESEITIHPDAPELCDTKDNDCDLAIDEGVDGDSDGFLCGEDCHDDRADAYPGAEELCDGVIDHDCDGQIDESPDEDSDGYTLCQGDCDDHDDHLNPGQTEVIGDLIDNDCDGLSEVSYYVNKDGISPEAGVPAGLTLQGAIDVLPSGAVIAVGPGTYVETPSIIDKDLHLFSIAGQGETYIDGRKNASVLSIIGGQGGETVIDGFSLFGGEGEYGAGILMDGAQVILRNARISNSLAHEGGGGLALLGGEATLDGVEIQFNDARLGGGIYVDGGILHLQGSQILDNSAHRLTLSTDDDSGAEIHLFEGQGGGIHLASGARLFAADSAIAGNYALEGGAIYHLGSELEWVDGLFEENVGWNIARISDATDDGGDVETEYQGVGGALYVGGPAELIRCDFEKNTSIYGGAIYVSGAQLELNACDFTENTAHGATLIRESEAGEARFYDGQGGAISAVNGAQLEGEDLQFWQDSSVYGGALYISIADADLRHFRIEEASAQGVIIDDETGSGSQATNGRGGAIYASGATLDLSGGILAANEAHYTGAAIHYAGSGQSALQLHNLTVVDGMASIGGGLYLESSLGDLDFTNLIIAHNRDGGGIFGPLPTGVLRYSNIYGNVDGNYVGGADKTGLDGNLSMNPDFVDFMRDGQADDDLRLMLQSPCVDAGDPDPIYIDDDGTRNDMGAFGGPDGH